MKERGKKTGRVRVRLRVGERGEGKGCRKESQRRGEGVTNFEQVEAQEVPFFSGFLRHPCDRR